MYNRIAHDLRFLMITHGCVHRICLVTLLKFNTKRHFLRNFTFRYLTLQPKIGGENHSSEIESTDAELYNDG